MPARKWVLIIYPVVTSRGKDNSGGHAHLRANIQVYKALGYRVLCIARLSRSIWGSIEGEPCLNIVPGAAVPASVSTGAGPQVAESRFARVVRTLRRLAVDLVCRGMIVLLRPVVVHQRANLRYMLAQGVRNSCVLVELNDEFVPELPCHGYLTIVRRAGLAAPQMVWAWPVVSKTKFDSELFVERMLRIAVGNFEVRILVYGLGGVTSLAPVVRFLNEHPWLRERRWKLSIYGERTTSDVSSSQVELCGWIDEESLLTAQYDLGLVYYSKDGYTDERLALGCPTKLWKYIDWSLPIISNREVVSTRYLADFDRSESTLFDRTAIRQYAARLESIRNEADVGTYASQLARFLSRIGGAS